LLPHQLRGWRCSGYDRWHALLNVRRNLVEVDRTSAEARGVDRSGPVPRRLALSSGPLSGSPLRFASLNGVAGGSVSDRRLGRNAVKARTDLGARTNQARGPQVPQRVLQVQLAAPAGDLT
jgi:hypothetical protein